MIFDIYNRQIRFSEERKATFDDIVEHIKPFDDDIVYLGGSLVEGVVGKYSKGMGNNFSDIDVFIIREQHNFESTEAVYSSSARKIFFIDSLLSGADVEVYNKNFVLSLTEALDHYEVNAGERIANAFECILAPDCDLLLVNTFLNRLFHSVCIFNHNPYNDLKGNINYTNFLKVRTIELTADIGNIKPDIIGNMEVGQFDVALLCVRDAFLHMMNLVLVSEGVFLDRVKWIPLKFKNLCEENKRYEELWVEYLQLFCSEIANESSYVNVIESATAVIERTMEDVFLGGLAL